MKELTDDISIAPFSAKDLSEIVDLLQRELIADGISEEAFEKSVLLDPNFRSEGATVARANGRLVGFMLGLVRRHPLEDAPADSDRGWITLMAVDAEFQRRGIGSRMLDHVCGYFDKNGVKTVWISPYAPNYFTPGIDEAAYPGAMAFLKTRGFETAYRPLSMEASILDLAVPEWTAEKEAELSRAGIVLETFKGEHISLLTDFLRAEFPGDWQRLMRETMLSIVREESAADRVLLATENGRCVGFCQHDGERFGPFGVALSHRGRGIGAVLLGRCLKNMAARGFYRAWLMWTDDRASRLYSAFGFRETRRYSVMKRNIR